MKRIFRLIIGLFCAVVLWSCKDDALSAGAGALGEDEEVRVCAMTMGDILSNTDTLSEFQITQTPDSFLVGECNTDEWRTIKADLMAQFACPAGFRYPEGSIVDSAELIMSYGSWVGDGFAPLRISVYEMDRATFRYDRIYTSQEDVSIYWSGEDSTHITDQTVVAAMPTDSVSTDKGYLYYITFKMNDRFVKKMGQLTSFPSQEAFNDFFKGLYIKTTYGASTALYLSNLTMIIHYHYPYETTPGSGDWKTIADTKYLYANSEVRQVNRYAFPDKRPAVDWMRSMGDSLNFIVSPGYVYTLLTLPMDKYVQTITDSMQRGDGTMRPYINKSVMRVDVVNAAESDAQYTHWASPATAMLLVLKDSVNDFFRYGRLPSPDYCLLGTLTKALDKNQQYHYYYDFDLSTMLQNELRRHEHKGQMEMVMVPVAVEYASTSTANTVSKVKIDQTVTSTIIHSARRLENPMDIDVVFSGFTITGIH